MPLTKVWADDDVDCKASLKGQKFKDVKKVEFVFNEKKNKTRSEVGRTEAALDSGTGLAKGQWKAKGPDSPDLFRTVTYHVELDGKPLKNFPDEIQIWAKEATITAKDGDDAPLPDATCEIRQKGSGNDKPKPVVLKTDDDGKIVWRLAAPEPFSIDWQVPWVLHGKKWIKNEGVLWEAKLEKIAPIKLLWPPPETQPHKQWVNLPSDKSDASRGSKLHIRVGPGERGTLDKGTKVYAKAKFADENSDRKSGAGGHAKGTEFKDAKPVDAKGEAVFELEVGLAGGDQVTIDVGSTDECKDGTILVENWRKLYYELMSPECMKPRLDKRTVDGKDLWDLKDVTRTWASARLNDVFVDYGCKASHVFSDAKVKAFLHQGEFLGRDPGDYYVVGFPKGYKDDPASFGKKDSRTIFVRACDLTADGQPAAPVEQVLDADRGAWPVGGMIFLVDPSTGKPSIQGKITWTAVVDAAASPGHPGLDKNNKPKTGTLPHAALTLTDFKHYALQLSGDAATLAGALSDDKCNIKVRWSWVKAKPYNGSAWQGRQMMNLGRPAKPVGATICHELGHSMGQTVKQDGSFKSSAPDGLPYPAVVPGGEVYDGKGHQGPHCASGLTEDQKNLATYGGIQGTCIMFGAGGDEAEPARDSFCDTCKKYIKARNLTDVKADWDGRIGSAADQDGVDG